MSGGIPFVDLTSDDGSNDVDDGLLPIGQTAESDGESGVLSSVAVTRGLPSGDNHMVSTTVSNRETTTRRLMGLKGDQHIIQGIRAKHDLHTVGGNMVNKQQQGDAVSGNSFSTVTRKKRRLGCNEAPSYMQMASDVGGVDENNSATEGRDLSFNSRSDDEELSPLESSSNSLVSELEQSAADDPLLKMMLTKPIKSEALNSNEDDQSFKKKLGVVDGDNEGDEGVPIFLISSGDESEPESDRKSMEKKEGDLSLDTVSDGHQALLKVQRNRMDWLVQREQKYHDQMVQLEAAKQILRSKIERRETMLKEGVTGDKDLLEANKVTKMKLEKTHKEIERNKHEYEMLRRERKEAFLESQLAKLDENVSKATYVQTKRALLNLKLKNAPFKFSNIEELRVESDRIKAELALLANIPINDEEARSAEEHLVFNNVCQKVLRLLEGANRSAENKQLLRDKIAVIVGFENNIHLKKPVTPGEFNGARGAAMELKKQGIIMPHVFNRLCELGVINRDASSNELEFEKKYSTSMDPKVFGQNEEVGKTTSGTESKAFFQTISKVRSILASLNRPNDTKALINKHLSVIESYQELIDNGLTPDEGKKWEVVNAIRMLHKQGVKMPIVYQTLERQGLDWKYDPHGAMRNIIDARKLIESNTKRTLEAKQQTYKLLDSIRNAVIETMAGVLFDPEKKSYVNMQLAALRNMGVRMPLVDRTLDTYFKSYDENQIDNFDLTRDTIEESSRSVVDPSEDEKYYYQSIQNAVDIYNTPFNQSRLGHEKTKQIILALECFRVFRKKFSFASIPLLWKQQVQHAINTVLENNIELPRVFKYLKKRGFSIDTSSSKTRTFKNEYTNDNDSFMEPLMIEDDLEDPDFKMLEKSDLIPSRTSFENQLQMSNIYTARDHQSLNELLESLKQTEVSVEGEELTPPEMTVNLLKHQRQGLHWLLKTERSKVKGGLLADDMGLGKTIQTIALILANKPRNDNCTINLVVAPVSVLRVWNDEVNTKVKKSAELKVTIYGGLGGKKFKNFSALQGYDVVLVSYQTLAIEFKRHWPRRLQNEKKNTTLELADIKAMNSLKTREEYWSPFFADESVFYRVILDEAQNIKNKQTLAAKACCTLSATYRWVLSGTPIQNNILELYSLIRFLRIAPYNREEKFREDIANVLAARDIRMDDRNVERALTKVRVLLRAIMLRRSKNSTIDGEPILTLPEKHLNKIEDVLGGEDLEFYQSLEYKTAIKARKLLNERKSGSYSSILTLLLRLRQACCHQELVKIGEAKAEGTRVVNGTNFEDDWKRLYYVAKSMNKTSQETVKQCTESMTCPQCLEQMELESTAVLTPCGHLLCEPCVGPFLETARDSPSVIKGPKGTRSYFVPCLVCEKLINDHELVSYQLYDQAINQGFTEDDLRLEYEKEMDKRRSRLKYDYQINFELLHQSKKVQQCLEIIRSVLASTENEKVVVFSQFTAFFDILEHFITTILEAKYLRYDGSMSGAARSNVIERFYRERDQRVLLISMKAGNSGLTLTCANHVILVDPFWNPYVEEQAMDRCYRISQEREVHVHRLLLTATVEDRIVELQNRKKALVESAMDPSELREVNRLGRRELGFLFGLNTLEPPPPTTTMQS
ncbi:translocase ULS1 Ecym_3087 [Eremothecium cymbalariae DBVPG|uniref:RING-type domain-containing protein n=1 Tax=Eremothecium cymbalariae (strain CBS 270.75 / DBVPG 7215 / KCTC 17166 / NRRL Y-17582) TaxID=931890 RepID=G8JR28_ERECY|nr:Hypothetical protein Ecym_3087 [Eremothecium cymbalariae DBVPG\